MEETTLDLTDLEIAVLIAHILKRCGEGCVYCEEENMGEQADYLTDDMLAAKTAHDLCECNIGCEWCEEEEEDEEWLDLDVED